MDIIIYLLLFPIVLSKTGDIKVNTEKFCETAQLDKRKFMPLVRLSITGQMAGPDIYELLKLFGREKVEERIDNFCFLFGKERAEKAVGEIIDQLNKEEKWKKAL